MQDNNTILNKRMNIKIRDKIIKKSTTGALIVLSATGIQYGIGFLVHIILARLLLPEHFGMIAFAIIIAMFINNFCQTHGEKFIIKEKGNIQEKIENIFTLELLISFFFLGFVFLLAPSVMKLLHKPELTIFVQVLAIAYLYNPFSKPKYLFERELNFKMSSIPFVISQIIGAVIAITMAILGFGAWSLVFLL
ncbi:MAG: oligosaccharide flippase family protein, partial [Nitrosopumilus sp.]